MPKPPQDLRDSGLPNGGKSYSASEDMIRRAAEDGHDAEANKLLRNIPANGPLTLEQTLTVLRRATRRASSSQQAESTPVQSKGQVQDQHESKVAPQVRPVRAHQQGISQRSPALPEGVQRPPLEPPTHSAAGSESSPPTTRNEPAQLPVEGALRSMSLLCHAALPYSLDVLVHACITAAVVATRYNAFSHWTLYPDWCKQ